MENITVVEEKSSYVKKHWRGELSLAVSYWVNNVFLSFVLMLFTILISNVISSSSHISFFFFFMITFYLLIFFVLIPWIYVGLWRSAGNHIKEHNLYFWANVVRILVIIGVFRTVSIFIDNIYPQMIEYYKIATGTDSLPAYVIQMEDNNTTLKITGGIKFGLTNEVQKYIQKYPTVKTIHLESIGGRTSEAKELAKVIEKENLDTYVSDICFSACTYVFIAGKERMVEPLAQFGFHKPSFPGIDESELKNQINKDKEFFTTRGVDKQFVNKIYNTAHSSILEAGYSTLKEVGIATKLVSSKASNLWIKELNELENLLVLRGVTQSMLGEDIKMFVRQLKEEVSLELPRLIDEVTRQESVEGQNLTIVYKYTILKALPTETLKDFEIKIDAILHRDTCSDLLSVYLLKREVVFEHQYYSQIDGKLLSKNRIIGCDIIDKK